MRLGAAAGGGDLGHRVGHGVRRPTTEDHMGAGRAEDLGDGPTDAARGTGDDGGPAGQRSFGRHAVRLLRRGRGIYRRGVMSRSGGG